jgi:hypothetical protein
MATKEFTPEQEQRVQKLVEEMQRDLPQIHHDLGKCLGEPDWFARSWQTSTLPRGSKFSLTEAHQAARGLEAITRLMVKDEELEVDRENHPNQVHYVGLGQNLREGLRAAQLTLAQEVGERLSWLMEHTQPEAAP